MQSIRASSTLVKRAFVASRGRGFALVSLVAPTTVAFCQGNDDKKGGFDINATLDSLGKTAGGSIQTAIDSGIPTQLSYGFIMGYCAGLALKKAGKIAATVLGVGFIGIQTLAANGYITIDHAEIKKDFEDALDLNDDGKINAADRTILMDKVMKVLGNGMPSGGGFALGFIGGLRSG